MSEDIKPTAESIAIARRLVREGAMCAVDVSLCQEGYTIAHSEAMVQRIAEYLTRHDRELTAWVNQEIREKTESLQRSFVIEAERRMDAQLEVDELKLEVEGLKAVIGRGFQQFHGTTWTHDLPKDPAGLEQCIERLRRVDGKHADCAVIVWEQCQALVRKIDCDRHVWEELNYLIDVYQKALVRIATSKPADVELIIAIARELTADAS